MAGDDEIRKNDSVEQTESPVQQSLEKPRQEANLTNSSSNDIIKSMRDASNTQNTAGLPSLEIGDAGSKNGGTKETEKGKTDKNNSEKKNPYDQSSGEKDLEKTADSNDQKGDKPVQDKNSGSNNQQREDVLKGISDRIKSDVNSSNQNPLRAITGFVATAATLGNLELGEFQHGLGWQDLPARDAVINPKQSNKTGEMAVTPEQWADCARDVNNRKDDLGRKWGNCAEKGATAANDIMEQIKNNPAMAGCQVRQCWSTKEAHSWAEVKMPNGDIHVVDPWKGVTGKIDNLKGYEGGTKIPTEWFNAANANKKAEKDVPAPGAPSKAELDFIELNRRQSKTGK